MLSARTCGRWWLPMFAAWLLISGASAQETATPDEEQTRQRLALMEQTIAGFEVSSDAITAKSALTFATKPLLRYSDPTRGSTEAKFLKPP